MNSIELSITYDVIDGETASKNTTNVYVEKGFFEKTEVEQNKFAKQVISTHEKVDQSNIVILSIIGAR